MSMTPRRHRQSGHISNFFLTPRRHRQSVHTPRSVKNRSHIGASHHNLLSPKKILLFVCHGHNRGYHGYGHGHGHGSWSWSWVMVMVMVMGHGHGHTPTRFTCHHDQGV